MVIRQRAPAAYERRALWVWAGLGLVWLLQAVGLAGQLATGQGQEHALQRLARASGWGLCTCWALGLRLAFVAWAPLDLHRASGWGLCTYWA